MQNMKLHPITPSNDPWEAYMDVEEHGGITLSNVEFTTTHLCNMRCEHCAVGYTLRQKDPDALPFELLKQRLDEIPHLRAVSITGGEPALSKKSVEQYVVPLLKYAHERGARTQINSNLTLPYERYKDIIPYLDVLHISHNWGTIEEFIHTGFRNMEKKPPERVREQYFHRMVENSQKLSSEGVMVSAETMLNRRTLPYLESIHDHIIEMGCARHEVHPMYPADFASDLDILSLDEMKEGIHRLLDHRNKDMWMLFGTLPFYPCSSDKEALSLQQRLHDEPNVTVRNDPDGRSRLNVNIFSGEIIVTDFGEEPRLGNIQNTTLPDAFQKWQQSTIAQQLNCHCPMAKCLGPNVLVKNTYYQGVDFRQRSAKISRV
ncbi:radical SAM/CxCxxxxC motif protein YfkAB [Pontibacillus yanchengensis]|uniref:Radical SAM/CxCxxxxC motif protein YfkAB n=2 Tax=Pontibacillus yanchengensis TaxID=462910 RepID=A0ACC7VAY4_9BACI|nr:radical SAM/CxCxxxxC motif protein YfkAB [Pontibacillus yanchengensis]MYL32843.1 radical SAM/CxCxxxxC motif protein YfkAB [Pontibacillus yanchengensis]MYL51755.1 radical SAM/CxCxxxxC motif protein YfkAB [Pontibacillus yanchengensis]